jgi:hypothetical protein
MAMASSLAGLERAGFRSVIKLAALDAAPNALLARVAQHVELPGATSMKAHSFEKKRKTEKPVLEFRCCT